MNYKDIIESYLEGSLSENEKRDLEDLLKNNPDAGQYFKKRIKLENQVEDYFNLKELEEIDKETQKDIESY